jgi:C4-dicarboxylate transporter
MFHFIIGLLAMGALWLIINYAQGRQLALTGLQWVLTVLGLLYAVFVSETIFAFLAEAAPKAALVMSLVLGLPAAIWAVLLARFVFLSRPAARG